ncbi:MAG: methyltransferase domain-containing protein [Spirochaetales bacterium]|nr:methyltransferase domain-containing protein [Spirochaetales bacterium]
MKKRYLELKDILLSLPHTAREQGEEEASRILQEKLKELTEYRKSFNEEQDKKQKKIFQELLLSIAHESYYCKYSYDKPRGYAGDFKNLEMIWFAITKGGSYRYLGETELGKLISSLTFSMENPHATVDRMNLIKEKVKLSGKRIASIGCGSCIEFWHLNKNTLEEKDIFLLDQDKLALERIKQKLKKKTINNTTFMRENIIRFIIKNKKCNLIGKRDFIYIVGLLDYFSVKSAKKILNTLWENIDTGGKLFFTNAHPDNPTKLWMEYVGEWYLNYKDEQEIHTIIDDLDSMENVNFSKDQQNVYQYVEITKK